MPNITKRTSKDGTISYRVKVFAGENARGQKVYKSATFTPPGGLSARKTEKAVQKFAAEFEETVKNGGLPQEDLTVDEIFSLWLREHGPQLKPQALHDYQGMQPRISAALGHIHASALRPGHIAQFYEQLAQPGIRRDAKFAATPAFLKAFPARGGARHEVTVAAHIGETTATLVFNGGTVGRNVAQRVADAAGWTFSRAFTNQSADLCLGDCCQNAYHRTLRACFNWAVKRELMAENPCLKVDAPKIKQKDVQFMQENDIAAVYAALPGEPPQYSVIVQLALLTGARRGEICALRWSDLDLVKHTAAIRRTLGRVKGGLQFGSPKTQKSRRVIRLSGDAVRLLQDYRKWQSGERLRLGAAYARTVEIEGESVENDLLFTSADGTPIDPNAVSRWWRLFLQKNGLPPCRFHSLRHSNASLLINAHLPVSVVSGRLGHAQTSTTLNIYTSMIQSADAAAADALDETFDRILGKGTG